MVEMKAIHRVHYGADKKGKSFVALPGEVFSVNDKDAEKLEAVGAAVPHHRVVDPPAGGKTTAPPYRVVDPPKADGKGAKAGEDLV